MEHVGVCRHCKIHLYLTEDRKLWRDPRKANPDCFCELEREEEDDGQNT